MNIRSVFLALTVAPAFSLTHIEFYSSFSTKGVPPSECIQAAAVILPLLNAYHAPSGWTWIIACDEDAWL
jgi:hypothetical protein